MGDWIYYCYIPDIEGHGDYGELYKIKIDGTEKTVISHDNAASINVVGDWIYYDNVSDYERLYKIKTDGTGKTKLFNDQANRISVVGDWIYYINGYYGEYKIKTDGTRRSRI